MPGMTRDEHLAWAKARALEYVDAGDLPNAIASMSSDLGKHEGFDPQVIQLMTVDAMMFEIQRGPEAIRRWIEGFN